MGNLKKVRRRQRSWEVNRKRVGGARDSLWQMGGKFYCVRWHTVCSYNGFRSSTARRQRGFVMVAVFIFLINFAVTWFLVGLSWFVQIVHFPLIKSPNEENF